MHIQEKSIALPSAELRYVELGNGPALVCLHPASGGRVTAAAEQLAESFRVLLPVLPGFDGTAKAAGVETMKDLAGVVGEFIDRVVGKPCSVAGHSFGGWVACWLAATRGDLVTQLVLQCPAGFLPLAKAGPQEDAATQLARAYAHPERKRAETKSADTLAANRQLAAAYSAGFAIDTALIALLPDVRTPTLILHGRKDGVVPPDSALLLASLIPDARLHWMEDAAHNAEVDQPQEYVQAVQEFLKPVAQLATAP